MIDPTTIYLTSGIRDQPTSLPRIALAQFVEMRRLRQARSDLAAMDPSIEAFLTRLDSTLAAHSKGIAEIQASTAKIDDLVAWRPDLEKRVADLGDAMAALQLAQQPPSKEGEEQRAPTSSHIPPATSGVHNGAAAGAVVTPQGPAGHGVYIIPRGPPATGQFTAAESSPSALSPFAHASQLLSGLGQSHPSIAFPQFAGENPNLWKTLCEQYFQMFGILSSFWVPMATLNFSGPASIWLQSVQKKISEYDWESFSALLCTRFGRDRHQMLIRQFYTVKQTTTVADFIEKFELIINHLSSYSDSIHPFYFLTRFVEGLRPDIRAVVLVQRPPDLDTACALALLQEEVVDGTHAGPPRPPSARPPDASQRQVHQTTALPLPPPPARVTTPSVATDRRGTDAARADSSKLKTLRDYRRARGLCFKCGERWGTIMCAPRPSNSTSSRNSWSSSASTTRPTGRHHQP